MSEPSQNGPDSLEAHSGFVISGRYRLLRRIASGGMATVWEAHDDALRRPVALKVLHHHLTEDPTFMARFRSEAVAVARLRHPSIVAIYDTAGDSGIEAIVMELVRGRTLREYLDDRGQLDPGEALQIGADVAAALDCAHRAGIIHRDIKPANILLSDDGRVLVTDFGIAKISDDTNLTSTGTMLGSVKYLAPEQVEGLKVDQRTDVYALGVVLFEALCGEPPFNADTAAATALVRLHRDPPSARSFRPDLPAPIVALLDTCLALDPDSRFSSADELADAIEAAASGDRFHWRNDPEATSSGGFPEAVFENQTLPDEEQLEQRSNHQLIRPGSVFMILLVVAALVVAAMLIQKAVPGSDGPVETQESRVDPPAGPEPLPPVSITGIATFDPQGTGVPGENDAEAPLAIDGSPDTIWHSELYATRRFGDIKAGVGLVLSLEGGSPISQIVIHSDVIGWSGSIFVADQPAQSLSEWGRPVATLRAIDGSATFELGDVAGSHVLVWVTDLGEGDPPLGMAIREITVQR